MPQFRVTSKDTGRTYLVNVPDGAGANDAIDYVRDVLEAPSKKAGLVDLATGSVKRTVSDIGTGVQQLFGDEAASNKAAREATFEDAAQRAAIGEGPSLDEVKQAYEKDGLLSAAGTVIKNVPRFLADQAGPLATAYAGAKTGAMLGAATPIPGGAVIGAIGGGALASFLPQLGSNAKRQVEEQRAKGVAEKDIDVNRSTAIPAAAGQAALETAALGFTLGTNVIAKILKIPVETLTKGNQIAIQNALIKTAQNTIAKNTLQGAARGVATEMPTEIAQQILERWQAGLDLTSPDAFKEYGETAYAVANVGAGVGGIGGAYARTAARDTIIDNKKAMAGPVVPGQEYVGGPVDKARAAYELKQAEQARKAQDPGRVENSVVKDPEQLELFGSDKVDYTQPPKAKLPRKGRQMGLFVDYEKEQEQPAEPKESALVTTKVLDEIGLPRNYKAGRDLIGLDLNDPATQGKIDSVVDTYLDKTKGASLQRVEKLTAYRNRKAATNEAPVSTPQGAAESVEQPDSGTSEPSVPVAKQRHGNVPAPVVEPGPVGVPGAVVAENDARAEIAPAALEQQNIGETTTQEEVTSPALEQQNTDKTTTQEKVAPAPLEYKFPTVEEAKAEQVAKTSDQQQQSVDDATAKAALLKKDPKARKIQSAIKRAEIVVESMYDAYVEAQNIITREGSNLSNRVKAQLEDVILKFDDAKEKLRELTETYDYYVADITTDPADVDTTYTGPKEPEVITEAEKASERTKVGVKTDRKTKVVSGIKSGFVFSKPGSPTPAGSFAYAVSDPEVLMEALEKFSSSIDQNLYDDVIQAFTEQSGTEGSPGVYRLVKGEAAPRAIRAVQDVLSKVDQRGLQEYVLNRDKSKENTKSYPYNISDRDTLFEEIRLFVPSTSPEYGAFVDTHVGEDFKIHDTANAIRAGQDLLQRYTSLLSAQNNTTPSAYTPEQQAEMADAIRGKNSTQILAWAMQNAKTPTQQYIMQRIARAVRGFQDMGMQFDIRVVGAGDKAPAAILNSSALINITTGANGHPAKATLWFQDGTSGLFGASPMSVAHEFTHAVTLIQMLLGKQPGMAGTRYASLYRDMTDVFNTVKAEVARRYTKGRVTGEYQKEIHYYDTTNMFEDSTELLAWVFSDPQAQRLMETIPYKSKNAWTRFVEIVRNMMGLKSKDENAFVEIMRIGDEMMSIDPRDINATGTQFGMNLSNSQIGDPLNTQLASAVDIYAEQTPHKGPFKRSYEKLRDDPIAKIRFYMADSAAKLSETLAGIFQGTRDRFGNINPEIVFRQAVDYGRLDTAVKEYGGLFFDADNLGFAGELRMEDGTKVSEKMLYDTINKMAKAEGITYEQADKNITTLEYGHREFHLREHNKDIDAEIARLQGLANPPPDVKSIIKQLQESKIDLALTDQEITDIEKQYQATPEAIYITKVKDAIRYNRIDALVASGRISEDKAQIWKDAAGYVPFDRLMQWDPAAPPKSSNAARGIAALHALPKLSGSQRKVASTNDSFVKFSSWAVREALFNNATRSVTETLETIGAVRPGAKPAKDSSGGEYTVYLNGVKTTYYSPDPLIIAPLLDKEAAQTPMMAVQWLQKAAQLTRFGVTATPPFVLKQVAEDIVRAMVYSGVQRPLALLPRIVSNFVGNLYTGVRGSRTASGANLFKRGVIGAFDFEHTSNLRNIQIDSGVAKRTLVEKIVHYGELAARSSDLAVREAVYEQTMKETGDSVLAEHRAREVINFSRHGASKTVVNLARVVPFFNAATQGLDKLLRVAQGKSTDMGVSPNEARAMFLRRMLVLTGMSMAYALAMSGDDEYEELPDYVRYNNWIIPGWSKELGALPSIPVPREIGFLAKAIPEAVVNYFATEGTEDEKRAAQVMGALSRLGFDAYVMNPTAAGYKWIAEWLTNYSFFLGRELESPAQRKLEPYMRYGMGTSQFAKDLALLLENITPDIDGRSVASRVGMSPIMLENTIRSIMGTTAALTIGAWDTLMNPGRADRPLHKTMAAQITGVSTFLKDPIGTQFIEELYDMNAQATRVNNTFNKLLEENPQDAAEYAKKNMAYYRLYAETQSLVDELASLRDAIKVIDSAPVENISPEEKRKKIDELRRTQSQVASAVRILRQELAKQESQ